MNQNVLTSMHFMLHIILSGEGRPEDVIEHFCSVLACKVPATLACARLSDSIVG